LGIIRDGARVELVDGHILEKPVIGSSHAGCVDALNRLFVRAVGDRAIVRVQGPVQLDEYSEPEPDLSLLRPRADFYRTSHPAPQEVLLIIEVSDTSAEFDRRVKAPLYARAGIPEYWIVDLSRGVVEVQRSPAEVGYRERQELRLGDRLEPGTMPDAVLDVAQILGTT
ncbi:MAG: Uma2 family endonuclease, partial [Actinomycetota bacterium]